MNNPRVVWLKVTSWAACGFGATHYYGSLNNTKDDEFIRVEVSREITSAEALTLNAEGEMTSASFGAYHEGDESERFWAEEDVVTRAKEMWREHFPEAVLLILGEQSVADPQPALDGESRLVERTNEFVAEAEAVGWWGEDYVTATDCPEMRAIHKAWLAWGAKNDILWYPQK